MGRFEKALLRHALMQAGGRKGLAAESLGIPRKRLYLRLKTLGLD
nr:helix-turn-helix domain-containing protein [Sedimentitalea sp. CY04]